MLTLGSKDAGCCTKACKYTCCGIDFSDDRYWESDSFETGGV